MHLEQGINFKEILLCITEIIIILVTKIYFNILISCFTIYLKNLLNLLRRLIDFSSYQISDAFLLHQLVSSLFEEYSNKNEIKSKINIFYKIYKRADVKFIN